LSTFKSSCPWIYEGYYKKFLTDRVLFTISVLGYMKGIIKKFLADHVLFIISVLGYMGGIIKKFYEIFMKVSTFGVCCGLYV
jgi:hypothetical protein